MTQDNPEFNSEQPWPFPSNISISSFSVKFGSESDETISLLSAAEAVSGSLVEDGLSVTYPFTSCSATGYYFG